jgi:hypothetical protein
VIDGHPWYGVDPTPTIVAAVAEYFDRAQHRQLWAAIPSIRIWDGSDPACPPDLRANRGLTRPDTNTVDLNSIWDLRQVLAHELGHVTQHVFGLLVSGDLAGQLLLGVIARAASFSRSDEETFANFFGAYLLGTDTFAGFWRHFPLTLGIWRAAPAWVQSPGWDAKAGAVIWNNVGQGRQERVCNGLHQALVGGAWMEVT